MALRRDDAGSDAGVTRCGARCEQLLSDVSEDPTLEPTVVSVLGNAKGMLGEVGEAHALLARFRRAVSRLDETVWLFAINFGFVVLVDDPVAAERELRSGCDALRRIGEKSHFSSVAGLLARALYAQRRYDDAYQFTVESEQAARPNDIHSHILWRTTRAKVLARYGRLDAGEALAREAVAFAAASDFLDSHGDTLVDLAEVLRLRGRGAEATEAVEEAVPLYEQKENVASAARARAILAMQ
jgi:tetratricopeptide (TPR) repeat protein